MNYSENQVRHLYVVKDVKTSTAVPAQAGDIKLVTADENLYFSHFGAGGLTRSDLIPVENIEFINVTAATDMDKKLKCATIASGNNTFDKGTYIVRIAVHNFVGMSDEDTYYKYGQVVLPNNNTAKAILFKKLAISLAKNLSRDIEPLFKIELMANSAATEVTAKTKESDLTGSYTALKITEVEQSWKLGKKGVTQVLFDVQLVNLNDLFVATSEDGTSTYDWGTVTTGTNGVLKNSKEIADLEHFLMGERADIYRGVGYPNNIDTEYLVDSKAAAGYHTIDIHYSYIGANEGVQKSEKTITLVSTNATHIKTIADALVTAAGAGKVKYSSNATSAGLRVAPAGQSEE